MSPGIVAGMSTPVSMAAPEEPGSGGRPQTVTIKSPLTFHQLRHERGTR